MSLTGKSAGERVKMLERYPDLKQMPTPLVYELALSRAEAKNYEGAIALFHDRFFGREEGGTNVRQVWLEVRLQQASDLANSANCKDALPIVGALGSPVEGLELTKDGLEPILNSSRANYLLAQVYSNCEKKDEAAARYKLAAKGSGASEVIWSWAAAKKQGDFNSEKWRERLLEAASRAEATAAGSSSPGWWHYVAGSLWIAAGNREKGEKILREVFLFPDSKLSHHHARLALAGATPR